MNKINKLQAFLTMCLTLVSCFLFVTACDNREDLDTNQLGSSEIILKTFGPCPIPRGAELRFIGTHLDQVQSVEIPGSAAITTIKVISANEVRVTVPQDAEEGIITLKTAKGEIKTVTEITYDEPIVLSSVTPLTAKSGTTIKIEGDYLNLIEEIIFVDDVHVLKADFESQSRTVIEVTVPLEAQTGKIIVSNGADLVYEGDEPGVPVWVYSDSNLEVVLPSVNAITPTTIKAGGEITITGADLDLVSSLIFSEDRVVTKFNVNATNTEIKVTVPEDAHDGTVILVAQSKVEVESKTEITLVVPSGLAVNSKTVKNGETLTITGSNLDLISLVRFGSLTAAISLQEADKIVVTVPETASSVTITLETLAAKTVEISTISYVKPIITSINPLSIMAGNDIAIIGTSLDLVKQVEFDGIDNSRTSGVIKTGAFATSITVTVPANAVSGKVTLIAKNDDTVESNESLTVAAADIPVILSIPASVKPGALLSITGTKLNLVESVFFGNVKATSYGIRSAELLEVYVPDTAPKGAITLTLLAFNNKEVTNPVTISGTDPVADPTYVFFDFDSKGSWWGSFGEPENNSELSLDGSTYFRINGNLSGGWIDFFWRNSKNGLKTDGVTVDGWVIKMDINVLSPTTPPFKLRLNGTDGDFWAIFGNSGLANNGGWYTVTIPLTDFVDNEGLGTNHLPNVQNIDADFGLALAGEGFLDICIDNVRFEEK